MYSFRFLQVCAAYQNGLRTGAAQQLPNYTNLRNRLGATKQNTINNQCKIVAKKPKKKKIRKIKILPPYGRPKGLRYVWKQTIYITGYNTYRC